MEEIDLKRLLKTAYTMKFYIILIMILSLGLGIFYSYVYNKPKYKSYTNLALTQVTNEDSTSVSNSISQTDLTMNKNLVDTYNVVVKSKRVLGKVINNLQLSVDADELYNMINVTTQDNTTILRIEVVSLNPEFSQRVANEIAIVFSDEVKELYNINNVNVLDEAEKEEIPYNINHPKDIIIFLLLGIFISLGVVLLEYMLDTTIKQEEEIEEVVGLPSLGTIPLIKNDDATKKSKKSDTKILDGIDLATTEAFRTLRTNLTFAQKNQKIKNILITSGFSSEGKSYVSSNLAVALAKSGKKIIIVDADMRKGRQNTIFKVSNKKGLSNFLLDATKVKPETVGKYIKETTVPNVHIMTSGDRPTNPSELVSSKKMMNLIKILDEIYDMVIIDGTPSILVSDSIAISKFVDNVIITVAYKSTKLENLRKVKKLLENVGAKITGVVLNKFPVEESAYGEKYYYSSGEKNIEENESDKRIRSVDEIIEEAIQKKENKFNISSTNNIEENIEPEIQENVSEDAVNFEEKYMSLTQNEKMTVPDTEFMQYKMEGISNEINSIKNLFIQYMMNNKPIDTEEMNDMKREINYIKNMLEESEKTDAVNELKEEIESIKIATADLAKLQQSNSEKIKTFIDNYRKKDKK